VRYRRDELPALVASINATGYGLTLGIHTRIDETIAFVASHADVGNQYVNRNIIGAVVGVQPFGGEGLSGTGPKAGGPLYLHRLLSRGPGLARSPSVDDDIRSAALSQLTRLRDWLRSDGRAQGLVEACDRLKQAGLAGYALALPGPTGERNTYALKPRVAVACLADDDDDLLFQLVMVLATGSPAVWIDTLPRRQLAGRLPDALQRHIGFAANLTSAHCDAVIVHGGAEQIADCSRTLAQREGPIVGLIACAPGQREVPPSVLARLYIERTLSVNTAAAGGNASLMTIG
jgi:RHH-type proline utilization regulon transcriptional repressor/proline dehydrogenase/delta 1-pyrroline-5-carboxylate dehydrogenase